MPTKKSAKKPTEKTVSIEDFARLAADFENFKKRAAGDLALAEARGGRKIFQKFLPILANLGRFSAAELPANLAEDPFARGLFDGVGAIGRQIEDALRDLGIEKIAPADGDPVDPRRFEILTEDPEKPAGTVARLLEIGWARGDEIIAPAKISAGSKIAE